jgi:hypothetical protein
LRSHASSALIARTQTLKSALEDDTSPTNDERLAKLRRAIRELREQEGLPEHELTVAGITVDQMLHA